MIYLDHNATAPLRPEVRAVMARALEAGWGNPSSIHAVGRRARQVVEEARAHVAALLGADREEIVFTSGGTEADNLGVRGLALGERERRGADHVLTSKLEHPAVQGAAAELVREGFTVTHVATGPGGEIEDTAVAGGVGPQTGVVALALANHELGNLYPVAAFARAAHARGALFFCDCVQAAGRVPLDLRALGVDAAAVSAHKLGGPPGVGALFVRRGLFPHPLMAGGHQERERRGGTENVPGIAGFGEACRLARDEIATTSVRIAALRDRLETGLLGIPGARRHGAAVRVPGTSNLGFEGARGQLVVIGLDLEGVCVSTGAACTSGSVSPSPVLLGLGLAAERASEAVRFSLGAGNTEDEIDRVIALVTAIVRRVRGG